MGDEKKKIHKKCGSCWNFDVEWCGVNNNNIIRKTIKFL